MSRIAPEVWERLSGQHAQGENLWVRRAVPDACERLLAAIDAEGKHHLLILLLPGEQALDDSESRGLTVVTRELSMPGHQTGTYIDVICNDAAAHDGFDVIGGELADRLAASTETANQIVARVISKWRRFWGHAPRSLLSTAEQLGLFAEIWFLSVWLLPRVGPIQAVNRWRGPMGARHDFEWSGCSVEVKATTSTRGRVHRINGLDQLALPDQGVLQFFSLRVREEAGATNTLPAVIDACRAQLELEPDALSMFEATLMKVGYSMAHQEEYTKLRLRVVDEGLYEVRGDFPRLTTAALRNGLPPGIERVEYEINLDAFGHLCGARTASDARFS